MLVYIFVRNDSEISGKLEVPAVCGPESLGPAGPGRRLPARLLASTELTVNRRVGQDDTGRPKLEIARDSEPAAFRVRRGRAADGAVVPGRPGFKLYLTCQRKDRASADSEPPAAGSLHAAWA